MSEDNEAGAASVDLRAYLAARLGPLAFLLLTIVTVSAPLAYLVMGVQTIRTRATATAELVSELIQDEAQQRPILWRYDAPKLLRHLDVQGAHSSIARIDVADEHGRMIDLGQPPAEDQRLLWSSAPIVIDRQVGTVWVGVAPTDVEGGALLLLLAFTALGAGLAGVMYWLPLKAIGAAEQRIERSQQDLAHLNRTLEAQVVERSSQLREALEEVRVKEQRLRELSGRAMAMQEAERRALSRELHDSAGQALTAVRINLQLLAELSPEGAGKDLAGRTVVLADSTLEEIRRVVDRLAPAVLDDLGLQGAVERQCDDFSERTGVETLYYFENLDQPGIDTGVETAAYRIVQESLTNVARHAQAEEVEIRVRRLDVGTQADRILIEISDDGKGFDLEVARRKRRRGVEGMRERVELLGGTIDVESAPGEGTRIQVELPVKPSKDEAEDEAEESIEASREDLEVV